MSASWRATAASADSMAMVVGVALAFQAYVNGVLAVRLGSPMAAAFVNFAIGTVALSIALLWQVRRLIGQPAPRRRPAGRAWWYSGGPLGALAVAAAAAAAPAVGVALVAVGLISGQIAGSLLIDHFRLTPGRHRPITPRRALAAALSIVAVALSALGHASGEAPLILAVLVLVGGTGAISAAAQGHLKGVVGGSSAASLVNFLIGTAVLAAPGLIALGGQVDAAEIVPGSLWILSGGLLGALSLAISTAVVGVLGVLRLSMGRITGQLLGSIVLDLVLPFPGDTVDASRLVAVAILAAASVIASTEDRTRLGEAAPGGHTAG